MRGSLEEAPMRPREQSRGQEDLFRSRLDQIINMKHALVRLGRQIDWRLIRDKLGEVCTDDPGQPPLPTRLMAGMAILKHMHNLSDISAVTPPSLRPPTNVVVFQ
jgi:transposase, IS5 family